MLKGPGGRAVKGAGGGVGNGPGVALSAPVNSVAPALAGSAVTGQTLTCSTGTWSGNPTPTYAYQWRRGGSNIGSATASSYVLQAADEGNAIDCLVTATNSQGSASADSNDLAPEPSAPPAGELTVTFGALTPEGYGGVSVTGTSISSGDASGHWAISGGYLAPSATGEGAITGTYSLTLDNAQTVGITVAANRYDVRTDAELAAVIALGSAARSGKTINLRPGTYSELDIRSLTNTDYCTVQSDTKDATYTWGWGDEETIVNRSGQARVLGIRADNTVVSYWRFKNLELYKPSLTTDSDGGASYVVTIMAASNVEFTRCEVHCDQPATYTADNLHPKRALSGIGFQSSGPGAQDFSIVDCFFHDLYRSTNLRCKNNVTIARNVLRDMFLNPIEVIDPFQVGWGQTERTVTNLTIRDNVLVGHLSNADVATGGNSNYHQAGIAFQMERKEDFQILANIFLPVYWWSTLGGIDVDEVSSPAWAGSVNVEIKGNICIGQQTNNPNISRALGGCKMIGNTLFPKLFPSKAAFAANTSTGPNLYWTYTESGGTNVCAHNIFSGTTSGPRWGAGGVGFSSGSDTNNLGTGHGQQIVTDASGVITTWQTGASSLTTAAGARDVRYSALMDNGTAKNTAGDFCNVTDVETLRVRSDIATYVGAWVGALGSGYVTFEAGHMSNPQASTIDETMEPA